MIGLEYILEVFKIQQKDLAEELGIKKQNITLWIKGKQNISKKYLPILSKKFDIPVEYFQKELTELDKKFIEKKQLDDYIDRSAVEYEDAVWDEETQDYVTVKKTHYDTGAIEHYRMIEVEEKEIRTINKIKGVINNINEFYSIDTHIEMYEDNIELFDRYADIIDSQELDRGLIFELLRALELCIPALAEQNKVWGKGKKGTGAVEDEREMTQEIYNVFMKYADKKKKEKEERKKDAEWVMKNFPDDTNDLY